MLDPGELAKVPAAQTVAATLPVPSAKVPLAAVTQEARPSASPKEPPGQFAHCARLTWSDGDVAASDR